MSRWWVVPDLGAIRFRLRASCALSGSILLVNELLLPTMRSMSELESGAMVVGVAKLSLRLPDNQSLKGKRKVMKRICERLRQRFNLAVAEIDSQDLWQAGEVGIVMVGNQGSYINSKLDKAINFVDNMQLAEIVDVQMELIHF